MREGDASKKKGAQKVFLVDGGGGVKITKGFVGIPILLIKETKNDVYLVGKNICVEFVNWKRGKKQGVVRV